MTCTFVAIGGTTLEEVTGRLLRDFEGAYLEHLREQLRARSLALVNRCTAESRGPRPLELKGTAFAFPSAPSEGPGPAAACPWPNLADETVALPLSVRAALLELHPKEGGAIRRDALRAFVCEAEEARRRVADTVADRLDKRMQKTTLFWWFRRKRALRAWRRQALDRGEWAPPGESAFPLVSPFDGQMYQDFDPNAPLGRFAAVGALIDALLLVCDEALRQGYDVVVAPPAATSKRGGDDATRPAVYRARETVLSQEEDGRCAVFLADMGAARDACAAGVEDHVEQVIETMLERWGDALAREARSFDLTARASQKLEALADADRKVTFLLSEEGVGAYIAASMGWHRTSYQPDRAEWFGAVPPQDLQGVTMVLRELQSGEHPGLFVQGAADEIGAWPVDVRDALDQCTVGGSLNGKVRRLGELLELAAARSEGVAYAWWDDAAQLDGTDRWPQGPAGSAGVEVWEVVS